MDNFDKLTRVRSSASVGQGNTEILNSSKHRKAQSFRGKNRALNWLQRRFSRKMSWGYDANNDVELVIAVAATAYSIEDSIQRSSFRDERAGAGNQEISLNKPMNRKERKVSIREPGEESMRHAGEEAVEEAMDEKARGKTINRDPTMKRRPTFASEMSKSSSDIKPESPPMISPSLPSKSDITEPPVIPAMKPGTSMEPDIRGKNPDFKTLRSQSTARLPGLPGEKPHTATPNAEQLPLQPVAGFAKADAWEKAEILKIKEQYEKLMRTILTWENKKKTKTRHKLDRIEQELERKRARASQKYKTDMENINKVAQGARTKAEERRRNKELEAKEEADKIRATGKVPTTCFCC